LEIFYLILIGIAAGIVSSFLGIGGGLIVIPGLVMLLGYTQKMAQGTSLALLLPPIGLLAVINYYKAGYVDFKAAGFMAVAFLVSSYFASKYAITLPEDIIKKIFATFLLFYALKLFFGK